MTKQEENGQALRRQIEEARQLARTLRDEIRVEMHLAGLDAQDRWNELEAKLRDTERFGSEISEAARTAVVTLARSYQELRAALRRHSEHSPA